MRKEICSDKELEMMRLGRSWLNRNVEPERTRVARLLTKL